jgi:Amt family ammonium transporter
VTPTAALCLIFILFVPLAGAGLALMNTGLGRSRNAAHALLASLCVMAVAAMVYGICGFAWQGFAGGPAHVVMVGGKQWSWMAAEPLFLRGIDLDGSPVSLAIFLQMLSVGLAALIPLGSGGERWRLGAACASTALLAGFVYPLFAHWVWGGGWLAQLGSNYGLGRGFVDAGGASAIQTLGGLTALSVTWILGPRRGKYAVNGMPAAIPGHNAVVVLFACFLTWLGWLGLNGAGAMLFNGAEPQRAVLIGINTTLAAASAVLATAAITGFRFGKPDASLCANGWVSGLVAGSAACAFVTPAAAAVTGVIAGALVTVTVAWFEWPLSIDDPCGSVSVHAVGGIWGLLALGLFARFPGNAPGQWLAQLVGIATLLGFVLPLTYSLNWLLNRFLPQRVTVEGERQGLDLHELGAGAYPEFVTHNEEFTQQ